MFLGRKIYLSVKMIGLYAIIGILLYILGRFIFSIPKEYLNSNTVIPIGKIYLVLGLIALIVLLIIYFASKIRFFHDEFLDYLDIEFIQKRIDQKHFEDKPTMNTIDEMWKQINRRAEKNKIQSMNSKIYDKLSEIKDVLPKIVK